MPANPDIRWRQRLESFRRALAQLGAAAELARQRPLTGLEQQGLIQAFEFTHELAWNTLKDFLESRGAGPLYGSKDATRAAFAGGLIADGDCWMAMVAARNRSSHTYNEATANEVATAILARFVDQFRQLEGRMTSLESEAP